mgnify:FL=1
MDKAKTKSLIIKIVISLVILVAAILTVHFINKKIKDNSKSKSDGVITVIVIDVNEIEVSHEDLSFSKDDTLWDILLDFYGDTLVYEENELYGIKLLGICNINTDFVNSYLALYVNDGYSNYGISSIPLEDGMVLKIIETTLK